MRHQYRKNTSLRRQRTYRCLSLAFLFLILSATPYTQPAFAATSETDLPDAPGQESRKPESTDPESTASITGTVLDISEAIVSGAKVTLKNASGQTERTETSDSAGSFTFKNLPAGTFKITIVATGLETFESYEITLHAAERYRLPKTAIPVKGTNLDVTVTVTEDQLAEEQVQIQIQQRVFGVFPNFYTSFIWNAAPLKPRHKFQLAFRSATDPVTFLTTGFLAGVQQARNSYPDYGQGAEGYAKRYGADYGDIFIGRMLGAAVLPTILHQDPRYFYQGTGSFKSRTWHALSSAIICRGDNGKLQFNYSHIGGNFAAGAISNLYRPDADRGVVLAIDNALLHTAANAAGNLVREFALRDITHKVPAYAKGKHQPGLEPVSPSH
jgi:hypothetical protein